MKLLRAIAGAMLATLLIAGSVSAAEVELLHPGGGSSDTGPTKSDSGTELTTPRSEPTNSRRSSSSSDSEPTLQTRHFGSQVELTCAVGDSAAIVVVNHSADPLPPGTRIKWQLRSEGLQGFFRLLGTLEGGETLVADNVLQTRVSSSAGCTARII